LALPDFVHQTLQKRPTPVNENGRGKSERHVAPSRKLKCLAHAQELLDQGRQSDDGKTQGQGNPETAAEILYHVGMVGLAVMAAVVGMIACVGARLRFIGSVMAFVSIIGHRQCFRF
jgi:hypothetical protein